MPERSWRLAEPPKDGAAADLEGWPQPLRRLLYNRGLTAAVEAERFLHPETVGLHDPFLLKGMDAVVERIYRALRDEELIAVYGDFDVDGLTGVALLTEVLESPSLQGHVISYLPHRLREGYGLNVEAIRSLAEKGVRLLITVDCGVGADEEIRLAAELGMEVIVTDHHRIPDRVPRAMAVLNPRQPDCGYPFKDLSGVGVAYKLAEALLSKVWDPGEARKRLEPQLDLVALGTVADMVPLLGENRLMVKLGLQQISRGARPGLRALVASAGYAGRTLDADSIAYGLAPRLNAAGRMGDARSSLELLLARSESEAAILAGQLETANRERQAATLAAISAARREVTELAELPPALVLVGDYPAGIVGLVAGRLAEEFHRPAFIVERGEVESRGSGRGVPGFDVVQALASASDLLNRFGGHPQAGGFALATPHLAALASRLESAAATQMGSVPPQAELYLETELRPGEVGPALWQQLALLEPHGMGNERPTFYAPHLLVRDARVVGAHHLKLWLSGESVTVPAIGFGMATEKHSFARSGAYVDCAFRVVRNERGGSVGFEMVLRGLRPSAGGRGAAIGRG